MDKKSYKKEQLKSLRYARAMNLALYLKEKCDECDNQTEDGSDSGDNTTIKVGTLAEVLTEEPSIIYESLTLKGYSIMIVRLLKVALFHKKFNGTASTLWGFIE